MEHFISINKLTASFDKFYAPFLYKILKDRDSFPLNYTELPKLVLSRKIQTSRFDSDIQLLHPETVFHSV